MSISLDTAALHLAINVGNKNEILRILKEKEVELNAPSAYKNSVLHLILKNEVFTQNDVIELFEAFLDRGIDPNIQNCSQETALRLAVIRRWKDVVDLLIRNKADINTKCKGGSSIAHYFVVDEYRKLSNILPSSKAAFEELGNTHEGLENESGNFVELMISKGFDFYCKNDKGISALNLSIKYNLQHISLILLQHTKDINSIQKNDQTLLHLFIEKNYKCRYDYNNTDFYARNNYIWYPAYASRYAAKIVKMLLEKGVDTLALDLSGRTPLQAVIVYREDQNIIEMLVDHRSKKSCEQNSATVGFAELLAVCGWWAESKTKYFLEVLRSLIAKGANIDAEDDNGMTPLYYAVRAKNHETVDFLNDHRADFGVVNQDGENLFHALSKWVVPTSQITDDDMKATFNLIASNRCCDVNLKNKDEDTPLHLAARMGNFTIACKLIESGAEVNCRNATGKTLLHLSIYVFLRDEESDKIIELLLKSGADVNAKDNEGHRPLHYVPLIKDGQVASLFLKWGAYVNVYNDSILHFSEDYSIYERSMVNKSPFLLAIVNDCLDYTNEMLAYGADINDRRIVNLIAELSPADRFIRSSLKVVLKHSIKLKKAGLTCCDKYEALVNEYDYQQFYQECLKEIEKLKNSFIDTYTSLYDFLHMNFEGRRLHINNEKLTNFIESDDLNQQFSQYFVLILANYRETIAWRKLLEPAKRFWREFIKVDLPEECIERIFVYLTVEDLVSMVEYD